MGLPRLRSQNGSLVEGLTDGKYKKVIQDRDGGVEPSTYLNRRDLSDVWYGIHEAPIKEAPGGHATRTPNYIPTPPVRWP